MKLKSYFSGTVEAAMELARQQLGEDALLVHAKAASPETRYLGAYEVVFGVVAQPVSLAASGKQDDGKTQPTRSAALRTDPTLGRVVALVGPPGAGKTTTLAKLAVRYQASQFLTSDVYRIAAADQLRTLAALVGIGCQVAEDAVHLERLLEQHRDKSLVLIDTPGFARAEMPDAAELARFLREYPGIDTHLVLPAFMQESDLMRAVEQYSVFAPKKLLFTRVDETGDRAAIANVSASYSLPVSFFGTGQQIPDHLELASPELIAETTLTRRATA